MPGTTEPFFFARLVSAILDMMNITTSKPGWTILSSLALNAMLISITLTHNTIAQAATAAYR
ncbi:hypothetical protein QCD70_17080 [Agreia sp. PsM10]|uniref:hypothetical protein n=1 Tax=Agreia sp. PsM10 TaxID=3030533 RepID=UPI00263A52EF|nr:hypothetical protein [Agreia sp. PsM10]MDN4641965.1 hypothetical protein [Agreia sp. PsM10]